MCRKASRKILVALCMARPARLFPMAAAARKTGVNKKHPETLNPRPSAFCEASAAEAKLCKLYLAKAHRNAAKPYAGFIGSIGFIGLRVLNLI